MGRADFAKRAVSEFAPNDNILADFYDFDILARPEARSTLIPPNLRPL